ncbi:MAG: hypothetical protein GY747_05655 [Planctomycetes bacterium]|nr:hypothetical protein [Planctomycetota bacterium]MCP4770421.1 hypothetical protein [Planctomycetota bacterium]MCP4860487.1 hypothetical protein [Planctomycetota bacterium]
MNEPSFEGLVLVESCPTELEASIIRNRLDAEGISTFLADAELVGLNAAIHQAVGGVKILTSEHEVDLARQLVAGWKEDAGEVEGLVVDPVKRLMRGSMMSVIFFPFALYSLPATLRYLKHWPQLQAEDRSRLLKAIALSCCEMLILVVMLYAFIK